MLKVFYVDEHLLRQENTLNFVKGGGGKPSALKQEYIDFYKSLHIDRSAVHTANAAKVHAASVIQHRKYNALPEFLARAADWRNGDGYVSQIASDAVR